jgi:hypothetical protein
MNETHRGTVNNAIKTSRADSIQLAKAITLSAVGFGCICCVWYPTLACAFACIAFVPPVHEQIAVLPAEVILLRGSEQPAPTPEELLRAARVGSETAKEELLRAENRSV